MDWKRFFMIIRTITALGTSSMMMMILSLPLFSIYHCEKPQQNEKLLFSTTDIYGTTAMPACSGAE